MNYDVVVAGGGIIGLTVAHHLLKSQPDLKVLILEKETALGMHASGRNSGVLHTGIYYPAETLKAKFCKKGADLLFSYAEQHQIPVRKDGKIIIARSEENAVGLSTLMRNAKQNGINAVLMDRAQVKEIEPFAFAEFGGIHCRDTAVIDSKKVLLQLHNDIEKLGGEIKFGQQVRVLNDKKRCLATDDFKIQYGYFINATGAFADNIAKMAGVGQEFRLVPFKGLYYKLSEKYASLIRGSIYPVPDPSLPFLGIHFTRSINNDVFVGPTAIPALGRENYGIFSGLNLKESLSILRHLSGLYISDVQDFRNLVHKEVPHLTKSGFLGSAKSLVDNLQLDWLERTPKIGIRPQLINIKEQKLEMDFLMRKGENSLHVLNSISPAFTSSFAVAEHIVNDLNI